MRGSAPGRYRTIVADPPWPLGKVNSGWEDPTNSRSLPYATMTREAISALPIADLAAHSAHLYLWTVTPELRFSFSIVEAWGFKPKQVLVWVKPGLGTGGRFRPNAEYVIFGTRGATIPITRRDVPTANQWPRGRHSAKPEAFYDLVTTVSPGPYLELFARRNRLGWDTWGNEALNHIEVQA